jgi:hypothetical protein
MGVSFLQQDREERAYMARTSRGGTSRRRTSRGRTNTDAFIDGAMKGALQGCSRGCLISFPFVFASSLGHFFTSIIAFDSPRKIAIRLIQDYQVHLSPKLNVKCLFKPSCSNYALDAIQKYGLLKGFSKSLLRLLKCNSFTARMCTGKIVDLP